MGGAAGVEAQALVRSPSSAARGRGRGWLTVYVLELGGKLITLALCPGGKGGLGFDLLGSVIVSGLPGFELAVLPLQGHAVFGAGGCGVPCPGVAGREGGGEDGEGDEARGHGSMVRG